MEKYVHANSIGQQQLAHWLLCNHCIRCSVASHTSPYHIIILKANDARRRQKNADVKPAKDSSKSKQDSTSTIAGANFQCGNLVPKLIAHGSNHTSKIKQNAVQ